METNSMEEISSDDLLLERQCLGVSLDDALLRYRPGSEMEVITIYAAMTVIKRVAATTDFRRSISLIPSELISTQGAEQAHAIMDKRGDEETFFCPMNLTQPPHWVAVYWVGKKPKTLYFAESLQEPHFKLRAELERLIRVLAFDSNSTDLCRVDCPLMSDSGVSSSCGWSVISCYASLTFRGVLREMVCSPKAISDGEEAFFQAIKGYAAASRRIPKCQAVQDNCNVPGHQREMASSVKVVDPTPKSHGSGGSPSQFGSSQSQDSAKKEAASPAQGAGSTRAHGPSTAFVDLLKQRLKSDEESVQDAHCVWDALVGKKDREPLSRCRGALLRWDGREETVLATWKTINAELGAAETLHGIIITWMTCLRPPRDPMPLLKKLRLTPFAGADANDDYFACQVLKAFFQGLCFTLAEHAALYAAPANDKLPFFGNREIFVTDDLLKSLLDRAIGLPKTPLEWALQIQKGYANFFRGSSGSGKTVNVLLRAREQGYVVYLEAGCLKSLERYVQEAADSVRNPKAPRSAELQSWLDTMLEQLGKPGAQLTGDIVREMRNVATQHRFVEEVVKVLNLPPNRYLDPPANGNQLKLVVVMDEIGARPLVTRGICATRKKIQEEIARRVGLHEADIMIALAGTGLSALPDELSTTPHECQLCNLDLDLGQFACMSKLEDLRQVASKADKVLKAVLNTTNITDEYKDWITKSILESGSEGARLASRLVANPRCAGILVDRLVKLLCELDDAKCFAPKLDDAKKTERNEAALWRLYQALPQVVAMSVAQFRGLNGLSRLSAAGATRDTIAALAVAMRPFWVLDDLSEADYIDLVVHGGILWDNAAPRQESLEGYTEIVASGTDGVALVIPKDSPRYGITEAYIAMGQLQFGAVQHDPDGYGFEREAHDFAALCAITSADSHKYFQLSPQACPEYPMGGYCPIGLPLPKADRPDPAGLNHFNHWVLRAVLHVGSGEEVSDVVLVRNLGTVRVDGNDVCVKAATEVASRGPSATQGESQKLTPPPPAASAALSGAKHHTTSTEYRDLFAKWQTALHSKTCLVILNGQSAAFADVIVLAPGKVVLLQAKSGKIDSDSLPLLRANALGKMGLPSHTEDLSQCSWFQPIYESQQTVEVLNVPYRKDDTGDTELLALCQPFEPDLTRKVILSRPNMSEDRVTATFSSHKAAAAFVGHNAPMSVGGRVIGREFREAQKTYKSWGGARQLVDCLRSLAAAGTVSAKPSRLREPKDVKVYWGLVSAKAHEEPQSAAISSDGTFFHFDLGPAGTLFRPMVVRDHREPLPLCPTLRFSRTAERRRAPSTEPSGRKVNEEAAGRPPAATATEPSGSKVNEKAEPSAAPSAAPPPKATYAQAARTAAVRGGKAESYVPPATSAAPPPKATYAQAAGGTRQQ